MAKILLINLEFDCAGVGWNLKQAIQRHFPEHQVTHVAHKPTHAAPDTDRRFVVPGDIRELCEEADVLHFNQWIWTHRVDYCPLDFVPGDEVGKPSVFEPYITDPRKKVFFHFHGGHLQLNPRYWMEECRRVGAKMLKCDPLTHIPGAEWMPNVLGPVPGRAPLYDGKTPLRIAVMGHVSDDRRVNQLIKNALTYLEHYYDIQWQFFGGLPRQEALRLRQDFHISIDNTTQGFMGMWGWESLAMGQVTVARLAPEVELNYKALLCPRYFDLPVKRVENVDDIARLIVESVEHPQTVQERQAWSAAWAAEYYTEKQIAARYLDLYGVTQWPS